MFKIFKKSIKFSLIIFLILFFVFSGATAGGILNNLAEWLNSRNIVDKIYLAQKDSNVVDKFNSGIHQAHAALDSGQLEYYISIGPIAGNVTATYNYASLFNPAASGKTAIIKKIYIQSNASTTAVFQDLNLYRISTSTVGTQIAAADIPKKNTGSVDSVMNIRHTNPTVTVVGTNDSRLMAVVGAAAVGAVYGTKELVFGANDEKIILQQGEGVVLGQVAAGDIDQQIRISFEWEEVASGSTPASQGEYMLAYPRVENAAAVDYKYHTFFNPAASGKTAVVKRIIVDVDADGTAVYTNDIHIRRITAASAGTQITQANIPKKHTGSANSIVEARYLGVTAILAGTSSSTLIRVMPPGAASQPHGHYELYFNDTDERLIIQQGEGFALVSSAAGNANHLVRLSVEWSEVASGSTPASQGEYVLSVGPINGATSTNYISFFNPAASGKTAVVKRLAVRVNAAAAAVYNPVFIQRITTASGGAQIAVADIPKKHSGTANSVMDVRASSTVTLAGSMGTSTIIGVISPGAVGQLIGQQEIVFGANEKLILQPNEGIVLRQGPSGDPDLKVRLLLEWDEEALAPSSQGEYVFNAGPVIGSTSANYNYITFFNPGASGKTAVLKRAFIKVNAVAGAVYATTTLRRISTSTVGTLLAATDIPKKHTGSSNSIMEIRRAIGTTGVIYIGTADSRLMSVIAPGAVGAATAPHLTGYYELVFRNDESIVLQPGEGVGLYQEIAGDADFLVQLLMEWGEQVSPPSSQGEYLITQGAVGNTAAGYVYASLFNPAGSGKDYVVKRIMVEGIRNGTLTAPGYRPLTARRITSASGGALMASSSIPKKHSGTATSTAELRNQGVSVALSGTTDSRVIGVSLPGAVGQSSGIYRSEIITGDEFILASGQGIAIFQEASAGDANMRFFFKIEWYEFGASNTLTIGATAGTMAPYATSGDSSVYANSLTCSGPSSCSALTLSVNSTAVTVSSIKITETGTASSTGDLSQLALFYDSDGNYSNGVTGQYGATVASFTSEAATVSGSLALTPATTYYFYVRFNASSTTTYPKGGQTIGFQIAANGDVTLSSGSATISGAPASMAGATTIKPRMTGITYGSGLSDGARSSEAITISGYGFGVAPGGSRANCSGAVDTGCVRFTVGGNATVADSSVSSWSNTSIGWAASSTLATLGGASALELVAGNSTSTTKLTYYVYPNITNIYSTSTVAAREYDSGDVDGLVMLFGDHFGSAQGAVSSTGAFGSGSLAIHSTVEGSCTTGGWSASGYSSNTVCIEMTSSSISDSVYSGSITLNRNSDFKTDVESNFGIMPRILSNTPNNGVAGDRIKITGNHFCQSGTCPVSPNRSDASNNVKFGSTQALDSDFVNSGASPCSGNAEAWTNTEICVKVPAGTPIGSQPTKVRTNATYDSNNKAFTVNSTVPNDPTDLNQFKENGTAVISAGGTTASSTVVFKATSTASLSINMRLQVEVKPVGTAFDDIGIIDGPVCTGCTSTSTAVTITGLSSGNKHWRARTKNNSTSETSNWVYYGTSDINEIDFIIDTTAPTITFPSPDGGPPSCSNSVDQLVANSARITWSLNEIADGQIEYSTSSDLTGSINYPSSPNASTTSHQLTLSNLNSNTTYYFKVKSRDGAGNLANRPTSAPYCSFLTYSVTDPAKTTTFFVIGATSTISGGATATSSFSVYMPENSTSTQSIFLVINGIYDTTGSSPNGIEIWINSESSKIYAIPTGSSSKSAFKIIHKINSINIDPGTNIFYIKPQTNTSVNISSAEVIITYSYSP